MKKVLIGILVSVLLVALLGFLFREPLFDVLAERLTSDMFVAQDDDAFSPGLALGSRFPQIEAQYQGGVLRDVASFPVDKGMIFIANRSVDW